MSEPATRGAIAAAVTAAAEDARAAEPAQLEFLPPSRFAADDARAVRLREVVEARRRGRPPGARNRTTREALDFVRKTLGDPLVDRAHWLEHTPETLAAELGCTKLEAFDRLDRIRADLQGLFYAKLSPVDHDGNPVVPVFQMAIGGHVVGSGARPPWEDESEQNQQLSEAPPRVSHAGVSHGEDK